MSSPYTDIDIRKFGDATRIENPTSVKMDSLPVVDASSIALLDSDESLLVGSVDELKTNLCIPDQKLLKVVSIFGNTGDGKSHTLNHCFFGGQEIFETSNSQTCCTAGVRAGYDSLCEVLVLDTEGLLGVSSSRDKTTRLLLKILAISDVILYRTRAERLHSDMFQFLGDASNAYRKYFEKELELVAVKCGMEGPVSILGPTVIIFHETCHTQPLGAESSGPKNRNADFCAVTLKSPEELIHDKFKELKYKINGFNGIHYCGTRTTDQPTDFDRLIVKVRKVLIDNSVRHPRDPGVVFETLRLLNEKFDSDICVDSRNMFPDEYFTCTSVCLSCNLRCTLAMGHEKLRADVSPHQTVKQCRYSYTLDNQVFYCSTCLSSGEHRRVVPKTNSSIDNQIVGLVKYAVSGYVLECSVCGIIYRSRDYWYGNKDPLETGVVIQSYLHVWPDHEEIFVTSHNPGRQILDTLGTLGGYVAAATTTPVKDVSEMLADLVAPSYWTPNSQIAECHSCRKSFSSDDQKHHCRCCGSGFCDVCSSYSMAVPHRGWGVHPVRVCRKCHDDDTLDRCTEDHPVTARKITEGVASVASFVATATEYPKRYIIDSARPVYWKADESSCNVCRQSFTHQRSRHHCRSCGDNVCDPCSMNSLSVPSRAWDYPVRVCDVCVKGGRL